MADDALDELFGEESTEEPADQSELVKHLRAEIKKRDKRIEKATERGRELAHIEFERQTKVMGIARELGFSEKVGKRYFKENPEADPSKEALTTWAKEELDLEPKVEAPPEEGQPAPAPGPQGPQPNPAAQNFHRTGEATPAGAELLTGPEIRQKVRTGEWSPQKAEAEIKAGRLKPTG